MPSSSHRAIGLLGGSFNPAHLGHLHLTHEAMKRLGLKEVWWLVSPRNPLKSPEALADYQQRLAKAREVAACDRRIRVLDVESRYGWRYSWQTVQGLQKRFPHVRFMWLMGADNLAGFHRWRRWPELAQALPVMVFDRAPYSHTSLRSKAALRFRKNRMKNNDLTPFLLPPSWGFVHMRRMAVSATYLRKTLGKKAFVSHNGTVGEKPHDKEN